MQSSPPSLHSLLALLAEPFADPSSRTWWPGLLLTALLGLLLTRGHLSRWRSLRAGLLHPSTRLDAQLLLFRQLTRALGLGVSGGGAAWVAVSGVRTLDQSFGIPALAWSPSPWLLTALYSLTLFVAWDLSRFMLHLAMHRVPALWAIHQVHHSAETLNPLTFHRLHPIESWLYQLRGALVTGLVAGLFYYLFRGQAVEWTLLGVPTLGLVLTVTLGNLRHSELWLPFPAPIERWLLSPAQHQLHHSAEPQHFDSNYGTWLAVWDRALGSLKLSDQPPLRYGLPQGERNHEDQLISALIGPLRGFGRALLPAAVSLLGGVARAQESSPEDAPAPGMEVIITAEDGTPRVAGSAHKVDEETLERFEYDNIERVLSQVPGVSTRGEDGYGLRPNIGIRGASSDRSAKITLMEDGVLFAPAPYAAPAAYYFPMSTRMVGVEVFKGPAATRYGPHTVGGVVNVLTRPVPRSLDYGLDLAGGPRVSGKSHFYVGGTRGRWGVLLEGVGLHTAGFKELDSGAPTGFDRGESMLKLRYSPSRHNQFQLKLGAAGEHSYETYLGLSASDYAENPYRRYDASALDEMRWKRGEVELSWVSTPRPDLQVRTVAYGHGLSRQWTKLNGLEDGTDLHDLLQADPSGGVGQLNLAMLRGDEDSAGMGLLIGTNDRRYASFGLQSTLRWDHPLGPFAGQLEAGLRLHGDQVRRVHDEQAFDMVDGVPVDRADPLEILLDSRTSATALAAHLHEDLRLEKLHLLPGLRLELIQTRAEEPEQPIDSALRAALLPGLGTLYSVNDWVHVFAGVYRGFSPVAPGEPEEVKPETSWNTELGMRFSQGPRHVELVAFFNDYQNLIGQCTLAGGCVGAESDRQYNGGAVHIYGAELGLADGLRLPWGGTLEGELSYAWTETRFQTGFVSDFPQFGTVEAGDSLPYVARHQGGARLTLVQARFDVGLGLSGHSGMLDSAGRFPVTAADIPPQLLLDAAARVQVHPRVALYATGSNLTGSTALSSWRPYGARPVAPRQIMIGVKVGPAPVEGL